MDYFVYILKCADGSLYTGISDDVQRRFALHRSGGGAKYTRSHKPVKVLYTERFASKGSALRREAQIKSWTRAKKLELIRQAAPQSRRRPKR